jgi:hypothetical protein
VFRTPDGLARGDEHRPTPTFEGNQAQGGGAM